MLRSALELRGYHIKAKDEPIGKARDLYFDDADWSIRYLVADGGSWLPSRRVLISPISLERPDWMEKVFPVALTREEIENSPNIESDEPVSRQLEKDVVDYFSWPMYWPPSAMAVRTGSGVAPREREPQGSPLNSEKPKGDPHLRSMHEVAGYHIQAQDGEIGHIEDFIIDDETWFVRYIVVNTRNWLPGRKVLLAPAWFARFDWHEAKAYTALSKETIQNAPTYDPSQPVNRDYEGQLYDFLGRPGYWTESATPIMNWKV